MIITSYLVVSTCYSVGFSGIQRLAFPTLNTSNTTNTMFVLLTLTISICFVDFDHSYSFSQGSFVCNFYTSFFQFVLLCSTLCFLYVSKEFVGVKKIVNFEYELIISFSILGLALINICDDFLTLYLAVELQSLCFYVLATFNKSSEYCAEAGVKYFVLGAFSSGLLLFGFTLFYASFGTISFESIERVNSLFHCLMAFIGCLFFSTAVLFKLGSFPFHMWLCDVYDGSMINITAFFSTIPKVILLSFFIKVLFIVFSGNMEEFNFLLVTSGLGSICFASVAALYQKRIKRLMAYSTVSHTGFLVLGIFCSSVDSIKACTVYIILYILMTLTLFSLLFLSGINNAQQKYLINWTSLYERNFSVALAFALLLLSVAGIPPLAGFYSKLCILLCLLSKNHVLVTVVIAIFSSIACFYYIRLIKILFFTSNSKTQFWFGNGTKNVESFISLSLTIIILFLIRPNLLLDSSIITAISLT